MTATDAHASEAVAELPKFTEEDGKAAPILTDFLKGELDRTTAKSRMLEDRARTAITLSGSAAAVIALIRAQNTSSGEPPVEPVAWLKWIAAATLVVVVSALIAHWNRKGGTATVKWLREQRLALWKRQLNPVKLHYDLQGDLITSIENLRNINKVKSIAVLIAQVGVVCQLIFIVIYLISR